MPIFSELEPKVPCFRWGLGFPHRNRQFGGSYFCKVIDFFFIVVITDSSLVDCVLVMCCGHVDVCCNPVSYSQTSLKWIPLKWITH